MFPETLKGELEEFAFEFFDGEVIDRVVGENVARKFLLSRDDVFFTEAGDLSEVEQTRLEGNRADGIVGAVVARGFVDGEKLEESKILFSGPDNELPQGSEIADAEIIFPS